MIWLNYEEIPWTGNVSNDYLYIYWCYYCFLDFFRNSTNIDLLWLQYISPAVFFASWLTFVQLDVNVHRDVLGNNWYNGYRYDGNWKWYGYSPAVTAGTVISGSFFGDKMSPISDTTNLAPASAGTTLYKHISAMWKTTLPAYIISFIIFVVIGLAYQDGEINTETVGNLSDTIRANF